MKRNVAGARGKSVSEFDDVTMVSQKSMSCDNAGREHKSLVDDNITEFYLKKKLIVKSYRYPSCMFEYLIDQAIQKPRKQYPKGYAQKDRMLDTNLEYNILKKMTEGQMQRIVDAFNINGDTDTMIDDCYYNYGWYALPSIKNKAKFDSWMSTIVSHKMIDLYRHTKTKAEEINTPNTGTFEMDFYLGVNHNMRDENVKSFIKDRKKIIEYINRLPQKEIDIMSMKLLNPEETLDNMALKLNMNRNSFRTSYYSALDKLKKMIEEYEEDEECTMFCDRGGII